MTCQSDYLANRRPGSSFLPSCSSNHALVSAPLQHAPALPAPAAGEKHLRATSVGLLGAPTARAAGEAGSGRTQGDAAASLLGRGAEEPERCRRRGALAARVTFRAGATSPCPGAPIGW